MTRTRSPSRILVVDDDADAAWTLGAILRSELPCEVRLAGDGAEAVDQASDMRPDVIRMDISMPGIDGIEAAGVMRSLFQGDQMPRLVAVTGLDGDEAEQRIRAAGFDAYVPKPLAIETLLAVLGAER